MRKFVFAAALAVGIALIPSTAQASWLSKAIHRVLGDDCRPPAYYGGYSGYGAPGYYPSNGYSGYGAPGYGRYRDRDCEPYRGHSRYDGYRDHRGYYGGHPRHYRHR
jgi:hypothetical protein